MTPSISTITLARKPLSESSVARNVVKHGTAGLNIDGCRIGSESTKRTQSEQHNTNLNPGVWQGGVTGSESGRWTANLIFQHKSGCERIGTKKVKASNQPGRSDGSISAGIGFGLGAGKTRQVPFYTDPEDYGTETVDAWNCVEGCPVLALDEQTGVLTSGSVKEQHQAPERVGFSGSWGSVPLTGYDDKGGASRFFKQVKADE